jgi:hypothetical protein
MQEINQNSNDIPTIEGQDPSLGPDSAPDNGDFQTLVDYCLKLKDQFEKSIYRKAKIAEITEARKAYEQIPDKKAIAWDGAVNIVLPLTTITIDNLEPRLVSGVSGKDPILRLEMEGVAEKDEVTKNIEEWFNKELKNVVKIDGRIMNAVHTILLEGTYYCIPKYSIDEVLRRDFKFDQAGKIVLNPQTQRPFTVDTKETSFEGGRIESIPFTDILCADDLGTLDDWENADKIRMVRPTYSELMTRKNDLGYMTDRIGPWLYSQHIEMKRPESDLTPDQKVVNIEISGKEVIDCIECYITYPINWDINKTAEEQTDFTEDKIVATISLKSRTLIRLCRQRELNFSNTSSIKRVRMFAEENRSYGTTMYGKMKAIQDGASEFFNNVLNIAYVCMMPWFFYEDSTGLRGEVELSPGHGVKVDNVQGVKFPNFNVQPQAYLAFLTTFLDLW